MFDPQVVRQDFPIFSQPHPSGNPLVYLDSAATSQKPNEVIDAISAYYKTSNANVHRGIHYLGDKSTQIWHESRKTVANFFGADADELIFVRNTTEALNLIAYSLESTIHEGDCILSTVMEHHSNLVPWQELAKRKKAKIELIPVHNDGTLDLEWLQLKVQKDGSRIKILAFSHVSNALGTINPISKIVSMLQKQHCKPFVIVDGAQATPHMSVDFHTLGVDFYTVSAHKMLGPMGIGAVFVSKKNLGELDPWLFGGGMIGEVSQSSATWAEDMEDRFTAGTPDVAGAVAWKAACEYLKRLGMGNVFLHDQAMVHYALEKLSSIPEVRIVGPVSAIERCGSVSFVYTDVHAHDVAQILDSQGVAVRSGHHCTMPLHTHMGLAATTRASFHVYTTKEDIDHLVSGLLKVKEVFYG